MLLTPEGARAVSVAAQGLDRRAEKRARKADVLRAVRRMGVLQIDTIHVVARSPYLVLWSRLGEYEPRWLDELLEEGRLFEYWSHEACFLPVEDYRLYRHRMLDAESQGWHYSRRWVESHRGEIERLLAFIRERGAVRSADFARTDGKAGGWWEWKTEKRALEMLFTSGELMIARRVNFQRVYDLRERVLPKWRDDELPPLEEVRRELALKAVRALGITTARWVADYFRTEKRQTLEVVSALAREGALLGAEVEGWGEPALFHPDNRELVKDAAAGRLKPELTTLLSPFDPLVWDRARARGLRLRLSSGVLHARAEAALRLLHAARPAARGARRSPRREGAPEGWSLRSHLDLRRAERARERRMDQRCRGRDTRVRRMARDAGGRRAAFGAEDGRRADSDRC